MIIRLDKFLADMGIGTRSQVKEYIKKHRVSVNGSTNVKADLKINTECDICLFDNEPVVYTEFEYFMLNKPAGVVSATEDQSDKTVVDLIPDLIKDSFPVGRLDKDTEGLLLITNDGALSHKLLSPKNHVDKKYYALVKGIIDSSVIQVFADGVKVDSEFTALPATLEILGYNTADSQAYPKDTTTVHVTIHEGKFHQVKRMFEAVSSEVLYLKRLSMGPLILDDNLKPGEYRRLTKEEIDELKKA
ncbi:MAG: pseudouridine synthase [Lachnospira sp.]